MQSISKILNDRDKTLFEKALKFYFFARQVDLKRLSPDLQKRIHYSGSVAYSLIITCAKTGSLKIEYMDFLNQELKNLYSIPKNKLTDLQIKPNEIDDIELMKETKLSIFDEDENTNLTLVYYPGNAEMKLDEK